MFLCSSVALGKRDPITEISSTRENFILGESRLHLIALSLNLLVNWEVRLGNSFFRTLGCSMGCFISHPCCTHKCIASTMFRYIQKCEIINFLCVYCFVSDWISMCVLVCKWLVFCVIIILICTLFKNERAYSVFHNGNCLMYACYYSVRKLL